MRALFFALALRRVGRGYALRARLLLLVEAIIVVLSAVDLPREDLTLGLTLILIPVMMALAVANMFWIYLIYSDRARFDGQHMYEWVHWRIRRVDNLNVVAGSLDDHLKFISVPALLAALIVLAAFIVASGVYLLDMLYDGSIVEASGKRGVVLASIGYLVGVDEYGAMIKAPFVKLLLKGVTLIAIGVGIAIGFISSLRGK